MAIFGDRPSIERGDMLTGFEWCLHKERTDTLGTQEVPTRIPQKLHKNQLQNYDEATSLFELPMAFYYGGQS